MFGKEYIEWLESQERWVGVSNSLAYTWVEVDGEVLTLEEILRQADFGSPH